jgi:hypothetical protein
MFPVLNRQQIKGLECIGYKFTTSNKQQNIHENIGKTFIGYVNLHSGI